MKKNYLTLFVALCTLWVSQAQRKSDLIAEIEILKSELDSVKTELLSAKKIEKASVAKAESLESQVNELQDANTTLLTNLNNFATVSNKNSDIANTAMSKLRDREEQLKSITDAMAKNDSTAIVVLTNAKQTLGENAKISVSNGAILISSKLQDLFDSDTEAEVSGTGQEWLQKIANILKANPEMALTVEGLSMTGDLNLPALQATSVANALKALSIAPERISSLGKDGNLKEGIQLNLHPPYDTFYMMVK
ncbi:MAG: hypothetical protein AAFX53_11445, partial [Bacteroidota bacterium]